MEGGYLTLIVLSTSSRKEDAAVISYQGSEMRAVECISSPSSWKNSPSIVTGPVRKLLPLAHAQAGHGSRGALVVHVLHAARGHLSLRHEGLAASRHCNISYDRHNEAFAKAKRPNIPFSSFLLFLMWQTHIYLILNITDNNVNEGMSGLESRWVL